MVTRQESSIEMNIKKTKEPVTEDVPPLWKNGPTETEVRRQSERVSYDTSVKGLSQKRAYGMAQSVRHLPCKHADLRLSTEPTSKGLASCHLFRILELAK